MRHASLRFSGRSRSSFGYNYGKPAEIFQRELQQKKMWSEESTGLLVESDQSLSTSNPAAARTSNPAAARAALATTAQRLGGSEGRWLDVKEKKASGWGAQASKQASRGRLWAATRLCTLSALEFKVSLRPTGKHRCWIVGQHSGWLLLCTYHSSAL